MHSGMCAGSPPPSEEARNILGHNGRAFSLPFVRLCWDKLPGR